MNELSSRLRQTQRIGGRPVRGYQPLQREFTA